MGFRNPITTAVDPVARASADAAGSDAARALTQIIPGSRLAADAIDGKTITGVTISGATVIGSTVRATGSGDASPTSFTHALQTGPTTGANIAIDGNEICGRNNGVASRVFLSSGATTIAPASDLSVIRRLDMMSRFAAGRVTITPDAANTPTAVTIGFGKTFATEPIVQVTPITTQPGTSVTGVSVTGVTTSFCTLNLTRVNTTPTDVFWTAVDMAL